jgi:hypothetical protein
MSKIRLRLGVSPTHNLLLDGKYFFRDMYCPSEFLEKLPSPNPLHKNMNVIDLENIVDEIIIPRLKSPTKRIDPEMIIDEGTEIHKISGEYRAKDVSIWIIIQITSGVAEIVKIRYDMHIVGEV